MESLTRVIPMPTEELPRCAWEKGYRRPGEGYKVWSTCLNVGDHEMSDGTWLCDEHAEDHYASEEADIATKRVKERRS